MLGIQKIKNKVSYFMLAIFAQLVLMSESMAQFAAPGADDISRSFLNQIFGGLLDGGSDAFGSSVGVFNGAVLTVGGILAAYTILAGTLGTAHDGEMLGKKFSSVWIPIRYALGTALVLPVLTGGYCIMQAIVMWIVMQGVALGNMVWVAYSNNPPALKVSIDLATKTNIQKFVDDVYLAQVCLASAEQAYKDSPGLLKDYMKVDFRPAFDASSNRWSFGDQGGRIGNRNGCGVVDYPKKPKVDITSSSNGLSSLNSLEDKFKVGDLTPIYEVHTQQIDNIVKETGVIAKKAILDPTSANYSELQALATAYGNALTAVGQQAATNNAANDSAKKEGWFLAGSWLTQIIFTQNKINAQAKQTGLTRVYVFSSDDPNSDEYTRYSSNGYAAIVDKRPDLAGNARDSGEDTSKKGKSSTVSSVGANISSWISALVTKLDIEEIKNDTRHPLIIMVEVGDRILTTVLVGISLAAAAAGIAGVRVLGSGVDITATVFIVFSTLAMPFAAFIGIGGMLSFILPNLPFMIWVGIIIGWSIMVIEAIVAAPLWAIMHLHPNGDDLTGRGGNGYMLVLGLLLRPVLIIFGLIAAIVLSGLFGQLINKIFFDVFSNNMGDSGVGFFAIIFGTGIYAAIMMIVIKQTFNLMHVIPDQLMRWIGGGGEQLGQYAGGFSGEGMAKSAAATGAVTGYMANTAIKDTGQVLGQVKQLKAAQGNQLAQQEGNAIAKQAADQKADMEYGTGYSGITDRIDASHSQGGKQDGEQKMKAAKDKAQFTNDIQSLGGNGSPEAADYMAKISGAMESNPGMSFNEAKNSLDSSGKGIYASSYDEKFGDGAYAVASGLSTTKDGKFSPTEFNRATTSFNNKMERLENKGLEPEEAKGAMSEMFSKALAGASKGTEVPSKNGTSSTLGAHLQYQSNLMNQKINTSFMADSKSGDSKESDLNTNIDHASSKTIQNSEQSNPTNISNNNLDGDTK